MIDDVTPAGAGTCGHGAGVSERYGCAGARPLSRRLLPVPEGPDA